MAVQTRDPKIQLLTDASNKSLQRLVHTKITLTEKSWLHHRHHRWVLPRPRHVLHA